MKIEHSLNSTSLSFCGYNDETKCLTITFCSGSSYEYANVPADVYKGLASAESPGRYFQKEIKGQYPEKKL